MSWQLFIGISVLLFSLNGLFHRVLLKDETSDPYAHTVAFYGLVGIFAFVIALLRGGFHYQISLFQLPYFLLLTLFATMAPILSFKAAKLIQASESNILISTQRLWIVIGSFLFLKEVFSWSKILGIVVVLGGLTVAQWRKQKIVINQGVIFGLCAAFCYGSAEIVSYYILRSFDATSFVVYVSLLPVITILLCKPAVFKKLRYYFKRKYLYGITFVSFNDTIASLFLYFAYQVGRNASQIAPILATNTILAVLLAIVFLRERENIVNKIVGAVIVVLGIILVL